MPTPITITAGDVEIEAELNDTDCAQMIAEALPIEGTAGTWGEEIYFSIDVDCPGEDLQQVVDLGDLAYWPPGSAFCMFFGMTPESTEEEIRPASGVTVIGKMTGDLEPLKQVPSGATVVIERA
ncbi:MAG: cyclophilin-like fold protein [Armatimonadota bacterium]|nr:cyclophilin-like fold protein [Armatimonadota bacterium]